MRERDLFRRFLENLVPSKPHLRRFLETWDKLRTSGMPAKLPKAA